MEASRDDFVIALRSAFLKKGTQQRFSLLSLIFFSIILLILGSFNFKVIDYVKITIKEIVYKSSFIVSGPENFLKNNYLIVSNHLKLYEENKKNITELNYLRGRDLSQKINILENIKYKKLIDDYFIGENETVAKVLIDKQSPFLRSIILNKGSKNNIKLGMVVLDDGYLVGKIVEVNFFTSRVLLISDINSKIPVSLQPGDIQAIMSGKDKQEGVLQYVRNKNLLEIDEEIQVLTSGAGGLFKSGIPIGEIDVDEGLEIDEDKVVNFHRDFSQLKYVKVVSFSKEKNILDLSSKNNSETLNEEIKETSQQQEALRILLEQKKIADEIRGKIQKENNFLKNESIKLKKESDFLRNESDRLKNEILITKKNNQKNKIQDEEIEFLKKNLLYGHKCRKNLINSLYKVGTPEYRKCVLKKGLKK
ncbi:rod shape-determining protein MreC [Candidatus Pelagibacter sp. Uisw_137]|uniref:rod shape-determining protein MreC n=1 Tax=Candidatus Pelagibacter sp. Uisw_137 TaxID=3230992 RepID=UPI0039E8B851